MVSGHVQAPGKVKISKSKGNAPADPRDLVERHGADATRYWALSARLGTDYVYSDEDLASGRALCVKLWNAARLVASTLDGFDPRAPRTPPSRAVDRWILARARDTARQAAGYLDAFEFGLAKMAVEGYFRSDLCDNWLEMAKSRLYDRAPGAASERAAAQGVAYDALQAAVRMLGPFVPHVAEAVHQALFRAAEGVVSVARAPWPAAGRAPAPEATPQDGEGELAVAVLTLVRRWRSERKVSPGKAIPRARLTLSAQAAETFRSVEPDVRSAGRVEAIEVVPAPEPSVEPAFEVVEPPV
jgi:valyl-tRNA synthetase